MNVTKKRNGFLDFLKLVFAFIIVIGHGDTIYGTLPKNKLMPLASLAVEFFFVVSGAMLLRSVEKQKREKSLGEDTFKFMAHKIKGLLPNYYIAWIVLFVILNLSNSLKEVIFGALKAIPELLFLKMSGIPTQVYNGNTWYISAMLLALLILYPLVRKNKDFFVKYIAPVISIFGIGYITYNFKTILVIEEWNGFMYYGLIRGIIGICIGCIAYELSQKLKDIKLTKLGKIIITIVELVLYSIIISLIFSYSFRRYCFVVLVILMIAICITLSNTSYTSKIFSHKTFNWMGEYSYSLYLGHSIAYSKLIWPHICNSEFTYCQTMIAYFVFALISGLLIMYTSKLFSYIWNKSKIKFTKTLVVKE